MTFQEAITTALELTQEMSQGLEAGDLELCQETLQRRQEALARLAEARATVSERDQADCRALLDRLVQADAQLQEKAQTVLDAVAQQYRGLTASSQNRPFASNQPLAGCVDRQA